MRILVFSCLAIFILGCSSKVTTPTPGGTPSGKNTAPGKKYTEDLSVLRPKVQVATDTSKNNALTSHADGRNQQKYVEPKFAVNQSLDAVLDSISSINLNNGLIDGFTIQVYSGIKREEALNAKKQLAISLPGLDSEVQYVQPNFRVRAGKYYDRFQAQKDYLAIKKFFPNAIVLPERISIR